MKSSSVQATDLVSRIVTGDPNAEEALVRLYARGVKIILKSKTRDSALRDDIFQDTFVMTLQKVRKGEVREPRKLGGFIAAIANNLLVEHYRKTTRRKTDSDADMVNRVAADTRGPFAETERHALINGLKKAVRELKQERDRLILQRYFFDGVDKASLCEELSEKPAHFDRLKYRALHRLKALVQSEGDR